MKNQAMSYFKKLPNFHRQTPGWEWRILKKLPIVLLGGVLIPVFVGFLSRLFPIEGTAAEIARHLVRVDILAIATIVTIVMSVFTAAIGCFVMVLMKGPAYVADAYELSDYERPKDTRR